MKEAFSWVKPNGKILEKARAFCYNKHPFSAMVGGIRNAKTTAACRRTIFLALAFPGNKGLMGRYESTSLKITTLAVFKDEIKKLNDNRWGPGPIIRKVNETESFVELNNDSLIYWRHLDEPEDAQGTEWGSVHIDELHECKEDTFNQIKARMTYWNPRRVAEFRANKTYMRMQKEFLGFNVTPKAYFYVTQNPHPNWTKRRIKENVDKEFFVIESTTQDNIENLPPEWWDSVKNMPDEWKKRMLEGSWDIAGGQVYKEFSTSIHVIDEFPIPDWWERLMGLDFGLRNPTACSWFAADEYGNLFIYDEHYETGMLPEAHAKIIKAKSLKIEQPDPANLRYFNTYEHAGKTYIRVIADPSGQSKSIVSGERLFDEYMAYGISCEPGNNDFSFGYLRVSQYLHVDPDHIHPITGQKGSPRLFIFRRCVNTIKEYIGYEWENVGDTEERDPSEKPKKKADHICLAQGTLIETINGPKPIEEIKKGDFVLTRDGYKRVKKAWLTNPSADLVKLKMSDGSEIIGTPDHPVWVEGLGFLPIDYIRYDDTLYKITFMEKSWAKLKLLFSRALFSDAIQKEKVSLSAFISGVPGGTESRYSCIGRFGRIQTGQFPQEVTSITKTEIKAITPYQTLNVLMGQSIYQGIARGKYTIKRTLPGLGRLQRFGMQVRKAWNGIVNMVLKIGKTGLKLKISANNAGPNLPQRPIIKGFAGTIVKANGEENPALMMWKKNVFSVKGISNLINIAIQPFVRVYVLSKTVAGKGPVFNLAVEGQHEYYANGFLTHNCDENRYVLATRPEPSKIIKKQEPMTRMAAIAANAFTAEEREEPDEVWN